MRETKRNTIEDRAYEIRLTRETASGEEIKVRIPPVAQTDNSGPLGEDIIETDLPVADTGESNPNVGGGEGYFPVSDRISHEQVRKLRRMAMRQEGRRELDRLTDFWSERGQGFT